MDGEMAWCPQCEEETDPSYSFCPHCGTETVSADDGTPPDDSEEEQYI